MKKTIVFCFTLLILSNIASGQRRDVTISYQYSPNGDVVFTAINSDYCDYFVTLSFNSLINATVSPTVQTVAPAGLSQIFRLSPVRKGEGIRFGYSYSYIKGTANPKINSAFRYLLPVKEGKNTRIDEIKNLKEFLGKPVPKNWYAMAFTMDANDTVYAARGGVVCRISAAGKETVNTGTIYTSSTNSLEIFHEDGTFGRYDLLKSDGILVKPGSKVNAGDPVGIIGKVYDRPYLNFIVYYLDKDLIDTDGSFLTAGYSSYKPKFALTEKPPGTFLTSGTVYTALKPMTVITQEMSKKEKERYLNGEKK